ncbi:MAG: carboxypeptidase regulatory-like domain-containing protein, partial [Thermoplasmata archaeon]
MSNTGGKNMFSGLQKAGKISAMWLALTMVLTAFTPMLGLIVAGEGPGVEVLNTNPANNATNVPVTIRQIYFNTSTQLNQSLVTIGGTLRLQKLDGSDHSTRFVNVTSVGTNAYAINLFDANLSYNTTYIVIFNTSMLGGNPTYCLVFTTAGAGPSHNAPTVMISMPSEGEMITEGTYTMPEDTYTMRGYGLPDNAAGAVIVGFKIYITGPTSANYTRNQSYLEYPWNTTTFANGNYVIRVIACDNQSMESQPAMVNVTLNRTVQEGQGASYIQVRVYPIDSDGNANDIEVFVNDSMNVPIVGAKIYLDNTQYLGERISQTSRIFGKNLSAGQHVVKAYDSNMAPLGPANGFQFNILGETGSDFIKFDTTDVIAHDADGINNDLRVRIFNSTDFPLQNVSIYIDNKYAGATSNTGELIVKNNTDGQHEVTASYFSVRLNATLQTKRNFGVAGQAGSYIYINEFVRALDTDNINNDVEIVVYNQNNNTVTNVSIFLDRNYKGSTNATGAFLLRNVSAGQHEVSAMFYDTVTNLTANKGFGIAGTSGGKYITLSAFVKDVDSDTQQDDVEFAVADQNSQPIGNARIFLDAQYKGTTDGAGKFTWTNLPAGHHASDAVLLDANTNTEIRAHQEFDIAGTTGFYITLEALVSALDADGMNNDVEVRVYDQASNLLQGAKVFLDGNFLMTTGTEAAVILRNVPMGIHRVEASYVNPQGQEMRVFKEVGSAGMQGGFISIQGFVEDIDNDGKVDDGKIVVYNQDSQVVLGAKIFVYGQYVGMTDPNGTFIALNVPPGIYSVDASYFDPTKNVELRAHFELKSAGDIGGFITLDVVVEALDADAIPNDVKAIVKDQDGNPINNAKIFFNGNSKGATNASGVFNIANLTAGYYPVDAAFFDIVKNFEMRAHKEFGVTGGTAGETGAAAGGYITLDVLVEILDVDSIPNDVKAIVKDQNGTTLQNAKIFFQGNLKGTTDANGTLSIRNLPAGYYPIDATYFDVARNFELRAHKEFGVSGGGAAGTPTGGGYITLDVLVEAIDADAIPNDVKAIVKDQNGNLLGNAKVFFQGNFKGTTNASGVFQILNLTPGYYPVDAAYFDSAKNFELRAHKEFGVAGGAAGGTGAAAGGFIMMDVLVEALDADAIPNDVKAIVKDQDGKPLAGAKVFFQGNLKGTTDANGTYSVRNLPAGYYPIDAAFFDVTKNFELRAHREFGVAGGAAGGTGAAAGGFIMMDVLVEARDIDAIPNDVKVIVKDQDGNPINNAQIFFQGNLKGATNASGIFQIQNLTPGYYPVDAAYFDSAKNFELRAHKEFGVAGGAAGGTGAAAGGFIMMDVLVEALDADAIPNDVKAIVKDQDGKPLAGAKVFFQGNLKGTTDANGTYSVRNLPAGYYPIDAAFFDVTKNFELRAHREFGVAGGAAGGTGAAAGGFIMMDVLVEARDIDAIPNDVKVIVKDQDGNPINNAQIFFQGNLKGATNASGIFQIQNLTPGYYPVDAAYFDSAKNFELRAHKEFGVAGGA